MGLTEDQSDGVIWQVAVELLQMVCAVPGSFGVKSVLPVMAAGLLAAEQARFGGSAKFMLDISADTAEFMYAFASAWQAPSAERMR